MPENLADLTAEADRLMQRIRKHSSPRFDQPPGVYVEEAEDLLGEDAPWHQIATVAHALRAEEMEAE